MTELPITLQSNRWKTLGYLLLSLLFVVAGVWMRTEKPFIGYMSIVFFGLGVVIFSVQLLPGAAYLQITREGLIYYALFRRHFIPWHEMRNFGVGIVGRRRSVCWDYPPDYQKQAKTRAFNKKTFGYESALPECYGLSAAELGILLASIQKECAASDPSTL